MAEEGQAATQPEPTPMQLALAQASEMLQREEGIEPKEASKEEAKAEPEAQETKATPETEAEAKETEGTTKDESPPKFKAKVKYKEEDGSDVEKEVDEDELVKGFMLEKSYRQKTAKLAREREAIQAEARKSVETKIKEYDDKLQIAEKAIFDTIAPEIKSIDWNKLAAENPAEWAQKYQMVQNINARLAQIQAERRTISEANAKQQQETLQKQAREAIDTLTSEIPGWNNDLYGKILKAAVSDYGFKQEEVGAITDPRAIKVLNDARQWRELKAKPIVEKKAKETPKAVVRPGVAQERASPSAEARKQALAQFQKTGNRQDAVLLAEHMLLENDGVIR